MREGAVITLATRHVAYWLNTELFNLETHFHMVKFQPVFIICNLHHLIQASADENMKMDDGKSVNIHQMF